MKRVWMLLLAVIALVAVMTIPAMAAEETEAHTCLSGHCALCCNGQHPESEGWIKLDNNTKPTFTNGGKYYIGVDVLQKSFVISMANSEITICLNGKQWIGETEEDGSKRPLSVSNTTTVNIVDCSAVNAEGVSAGRITGSDITWRKQNNNMSRGGNLYAIDGGVIKIYNGTMEGGTAFSGGNVYIGGTSVGGKLYIYGGVIKGGEAISYTVTTTSGETTEKKQEGSGGNIFVATATCEVYIHGGKVVGGAVETQTGTAETARGPAIYVNAGKLDMKNTVITAYDGETLISRGRNGGLITITNSNANFTAENTTFYGGESINAGGTIRIEKASSVSLTECTIYSGKGCDGAALFANNIGTVTMDKVTVSALEKLSGKNHGLIYVYNKDCNMQFLNGTIDATNVDVNTGGTTLTVYDGNVTVKNSTLKGGTAPRAVALQALAGCNELVIENCDIYPGYARSEVTGGSAVGFAGGTVTLKNSRVYGHTINDQGQVTYLGTAANHGGAIYVDGASLTIEGGTVYGGQAEVSGGAVYLTSGSVEVKGNAVISGGKAVNGAVVYAEGGTFKVNGATITGYNNGTLAAEGTNGGLICIRGTKVKFEATNAIFVGGKSKNAGGAFRVEAAQEFKITGGTITASDSQTSKGAAIMILAAPVILDGVKIEAAEGYSGDDGLIYLNSVSANLTLQNNTVIDASPVTKITNGAAINQVSGTTTMVNSTIYGGVAENGGAVRVLDGSFTMKGGTLYGAKANQGGAVYMTGGTFNFYSGTIIGAEAMHGGAIYVNGSGKDVSLFNAAPDPDDTNAASTTRVIKDGYGTHTTTGGGNIRIRYCDLVLDSVDVIDGKAKSADAGMNMFLSENYNVTIKGNTHIAGGVIARSTGGSTITIEGNPVIDKTLTTPGKTDPGLGLKLMGGIAMNLTGLGTAADIKITCENTTAAISNAAETTALAEGWAACFTAEQAGYGIGVVDNKVMLVDAAQCAKLNGVATHTLPVAALKANQNDLLQMQADHTGDVTVPAGAWLDLNGKTLTGNVAINTGVLYLLDSVSADYSLEEKNGEYVYGKVIGQISNADSLATSFTTYNQNNYTGNHRYIVLKDADGTYHAHRIYLAVKSVVLYPQGPHMRYRTEFKCDQVVAENAEYGVQISGIPYGETEVKTVMVPYKAAVAGAGASNLRIAGLTNLISGAESDSYLATMEYTACGYIDVNGQKFTSAEVKRTFQKLVEDVDDMWAANKEEVTESIKAALVEMYETYADIMGSETWDIPKIKAAAAKKQ